MTTAPRWRKSSHSGQEGDCVELAQSLDAVRDSKNPGGPVLRVRSLRVFLDQVKAGRIEMSERTG